MSEEMTAVSVGMEPGQYLRHITAQRHPGTREIVRWFDYGHLPEGLPRYVSAQASVLATDMVEELPDSPELTTGLRKLLEAKDCFVRAAIAAARTTDGGHG